MQNYHTVKTADIKDNGPPRADLCLSHPRNKNSPQFSRHGPFVFVVVCVVTFSYMSEIIILKENKYATK